MLPVLLSQVTADANDLTPYIPVIVMLLLGGAIAVGLVALVTIIGTRPKSPVKSTPFEAGSVPAGPAWRRVHARYYLVALLFLVFDLEVVFLFVWAPVLQELGPGGLAVMALFVLLLLVGLGYEWGKGALDWTADEKEETAS